MSKKTVLFIIVFLFFYFIGVKLGKGFGTCFVNTKYISWIKWS